MNGICSKRTWSRLRLMLARVFDGPPLTHQPQIVLGMLKVILSRDKVAA